MKQRFFIIVLTLIFWEQIAMANQHDKNVLGTPLEPHSSDTPTGFYRDGYCRTGPDDQGVHVVAGIVTEDFLRFTKIQGNDLQTPHPEWNFPGLKAGDHWCLCAQRWREAEQAGVAPPIDLQATHEKALKYIPLQTLMKYEKK